MEAYISTLRSKDLGNLLFLVRLASYVVGIDTELVLVFLFTPLQQDLHTRHRGRDERTKQTHLSKLQDGDQKKYRSHNADRQSTSRRQPRV